MLNACPATFAISERDGESSLLPACGEKEACRMLNACPAAFAIGERDGESFLLPACAEKVAAAG